MFRLTARQRRRWTLPFMVLLLLHWVCGIGEAAATYICFEPDGQIKVESAAKRSSELAGPKAHAKHCADLPVDDSNPQDDPLPGPHAQAPDFGLGAAVLPVAFLIPSLLDNVPQGSLSGDSPPLPRYSVTLRKTTVLLI